MIMPISTKYVVHFELTSLENMLLTLVFIDFQHQSVTNVETIIIKSIIFNINYKIIVGIHYTTSVLSKTDVV